MKAFEHRRTQVIRIVDDEEPLPRILGIEPFLDTSADLTLLLSIDQQPSLSGNFQIVCEEMLLRRSVHPKHTVGRSRVIRQLQRKLSFSTNSFRSAYKLVLEPKILKWRVDQVQPGAA